MNPKDIEKEFVLRKLIGTLDKIEFRILETKSQNRIWGATFESRYPTYPEFVTLYKREEFLKKYKKKTKK